MKKAVELFTFLVLTFLLIYWASASLPMPFSIIIELLAVAIPLGVGYAASRRYKEEREAVAGVAESEPSLLGLTKEGVRDTLPLIAPTLAIIFLASFLTSLLLGALGLSGDTVEDAPLLEMILMHALMPAILEEALFRYLPMKLIAPYSKRWCVLLSSAYFALIHMNLFQLPYALLAGFIFILIDVATESVWPSIILHFVNNVLSVLWIKYSGDGVFVVWYLVMLISPALVGLALVFVRRRRYAALVKEAYTSGTALGDNYAPAIFVIFTLAMTVLNLF